MSIGTGRQCVSDPVPPPSRYGWRDGACAEYGHPGMTFHPQMVQTWCQCGAVARPGDHVDWDHKHPASPLREWWDEDARDQTIASWSRGGLPIPTYSKEMTS